MEPSSLIEACNGADFIFNGLNPPYTKWKKYCLPMAKNVIAAAKATGATHLFPGNVYNYGSNIPEFCDENTPEAANKGKGKIRMDMEALFRRASKESVKTIVLRAGDFYGGPIKGAWFDLVLTSKLYKSTFTYPGPRDQIHAWAYLPDLAEAFVSLAENADKLSSFERFTFPGHSLTGSDIHNVCEQVLQKQLKSAGLPWPIIKLGGVVVPMWREIAEQSYLWQRPHQLSGEKLKSVVGELNITPVTTAMFQALADLDLIKLQYATETDQLKHV